MTTRGGAVAYLDEHPEVDIVLCDVVMPGINGWELLEKIRVQFPLVTFILYSGHPEMLKRKESQACMPDYVLQKPFNMKDLVEITRTLGRQRL